MPGLNREIVEQIQLLHFVTSRLDKKTASLLGSTYPGLVSQKHLKTKMIVKLSIIYKGQ